jgi:hypothetical protein
MKMFLAREGWQDQRVADHDQAGPDTVRIIPEQRSAPLQKARRNPMIEGQRRKLRLAHRSPGGSTADAAGRRGAQALGIGAAPLAGVAIAPPVAARQTADGIWSGGPILTLNDRAMGAEAVAVAKGRILAGGKRSDVMKLEGPTTQLVSLEGRSLVPGLFDAGVRGRRRPSLAGV